MRMGRPNRSGITPASPCTHGGRDLDAGYDEAADRAAGMSRHRHTHSLLVSRTIRLSQLLGLLARVSVFLFGFIDGFTCFFMVRPFIIVVVSRSSPAFGTE